jgi:membrane-bound lytic murein transglycosylase D
VFQVVPVHAAGIIHVIQPGETLGSIARRYGVSVAAIQSANGLSNANQIIAGASLIIPSGSSDYYSASPAASVYSTGTPNQAGYSYTYKSDAAPQSGSGYATSPTRPSQTAGSCIGPYTVQFGDTLSAIAARCGFSASGLAAANGLSPSSSLFSGQRLVLSNAAGGSYYGYSNSWATPAPSLSASCTNPYYARSGDTLAGIAARCGVSVEDLYCWNNRWSDAIWPGMRLVTRGPAYSNPGPSAWATPTLVPAAPFAPGPSPRSAWPTATPVPPARFAPGRAVSPTPGIEPTISPW